MRERVRERRRERVCPLIGGSIMRWRVRRPVYGIPIERSEEKR
jgi:hypothetical protein